MNRSPSIARVVCSAFLAVLWGASGPARALDPKPEDHPARWSGEVWGRVRAVPAIARHGDQIHLHGLVVGGPAADPWWSCSQYSGWVANGTSEIVLVVPGDWQMPNDGHDYFDNLVNIMKRDQGELPPYGYANRLSETCYCEVTTFGAQGGCASREHQPMLFHMMDPMNPREGNVQFATVQSGHGWTMVQARFSGRAGVGWSDTANDYVYVVPADAPLDEDVDGDGLPDAWEYAHSPNRNLDDFSAATPSASASRALARGEAGATGGVDPYAPKEAGWVPAAVGDWDGDGISDREEYRRWKSRAVDGDGIPYDPTYINAPSRAADDGCGVASVGLEVGGSERGLAWALGVVMALGAARMAAARTRARR